MTDYRTFVVRWAWGGPPALDPEWALIADEVHRYYADRLRQHGDPLAEVPPCLVGPRHPSRQP